jgi:hypothetical protein
MARRARNSRRRQRSGSYDALMARILKMRGGREALKRYRRFWGIKHPPEIRVLNMPGPQKEMVLVGMGKSPALNLADGPEGRHRRKVRRAHKGIVACDASGRRIYILRTGRGARRRGKPRFVGYANLLEYLPTKAVERAGSFKRNKHWVHRMGEEGGTWPKVYMDQNGNYVFSKGSYRVGKWVIN